MNKFRTVVSLLTMAAAAVAGFFLGAALGDGVGGALLLSLMAGAACIVYVLDNPIR